MSYEIFEKKSVRIGRPSVTINPVGKIYFNQETTDWLRARKIKQVLLGWNSDDLMVIVKSARSTDTRAYRLAYNNKGGGSTITARSFLNWINFDKEMPLLTVDVGIDDDEKTIEFGIPGEYLEDDE